MNGGGASERSGLLGIKKMMMGMEGTEGWPYMHDSCAPFPDPIY